MALQAIPIFLGAFRGVGLIGALAGGSSVAARVYSRHRSGKRIDTVQAIRVVGKEAVGTGVATAAGMTAVAILGRSLFPPIATALLAATAAKFLYDHLMRRV